MNDKSESTQFWNISVSMKQHIDGLRKSPLHASLKSKSIFKKNSIQA
jgi:hypothetical protein